MGACGWWRTGSLHISNMYHSLFYIQYGMYIFMILFTGWLKVIRSIKTGTFRTLKLLVYSRKYGEIGEMIYVGMWSWRPIVRRPLKSFRGESSNHSHAKYHFDRLCSNHICQASQKKRVLLFFGTLVMGLEKILFGKFMYLISDFQISPTLKNPKEFN